MIITMQDMRRVNYCASGVEAFFKRENLDFNHFLQHGIDDSVLLEINSVFVRKCIDAAHKARGNK
ncbi:hypothetical protein QJU96_10040 [Pasteurella skyensis]|uniref:Uncharacterized protein n=1 Tax=Phocoenobacter skyensis TaxID=97481 RepID=A0AAJ6P372_9PAST|nr:hypothetical protein [Pasteurella skyensis]MDP8171622.1 hypothetical protein [Pasteurella skyensis]MDP8175458.1 hypothetical protein [Pasteurella skyensis]